MKKSKKSGDATGWKRGAVGIDGAFDRDGKEFIKTCDPKADRFIYGPDYVGKFNKVTGR